MPLGKAPLSPFYASYIYIYTHIHYTRARAAPYALTLRLFVRRTRARDAHCENTGNSTPMDSSLLFIPVQRRI